MARGAADVVDLHQALAVGVHLLDEALESSSRTGLFGKGRDRLQRHLLGLGRSGGKREQARRAKQSFSSQFPRVGFVSARPWNHVSGTLGKPKPRHATTRSGALPVQYAVEYNRIPESTRTPMAERSFKEEVEKLKLGDGAEFHGEGILAVTKALLQSGVSYVAGYQGAPISHLMDVLADANEILEGLGVHFENSRQRGDRGGHPRRFGELSAARRGHLQVHGRHQRRLRRAGQPRLGRRHRRRAGHHRRGLRRRLLDHAGARACLRDEVADVAARSAAEPAVDRARRSRPASSCRRRRTRR